MKGIDLRKKGKKKSPQMGRENIQPIRIITKPGRNNNAYERFIYDFLTKAMREGVDLSKIKKETIRSILNPR